MADNEIKPEAIWEECMGRLDAMVNGLTVTAREQGAKALGPIDLVRVNNTLQQQRVSEFMTRWLAATAVTRLVNEALARGDELPNN